MSGFRRRRLTVRDDGQPAKVIREIAIRFNQAVRIVTSTVESMRIGRQKSMDEEAANPGMQPILEQPADPGRAFLARTR